MDLSFGDQPSSVDDDCNDRAVTPCSGGRGASVQPVKRRPHIIVFANEKGGVGKSTLAFHTCAALCNAGEAVLALDLDTRQQSLGHALISREGTGRRLKVAFPLPRYSVLNHLTLAGLQQEINRLGSQSAFIVIDVAGHDSPIARHAIAMADTLVTPVNNSFVDLDGLGRFDPVSFELKELGGFSTLVGQLRDMRASPIDWVVTPNRLRRLGTANEKRFAATLHGLGPVAGFRIAPGVGERVIYRDLFPFGLTLYDLKRIPDFARAQPAAMTEMDAVLRAFRLPQFQAK